MRIYEAGEKVIITKDMSYHNIPIGEVVELTSAECFEGGQLLSAKGKCFSEEECEPYIEPKEDTSFVPRFFRCTSPDPHTKEYYHKVGNVYIEINPCRYAELGLEYDELQEDEILITDGEDYQIISNEELELLFEEVN